MSSSTDRPVRIGRIGRPHGVRGEVTIVPSTDDPRRFEPGVRLVTESGIVLTVASASPYRDRGLIVGFSGVTDRSAAEALRGEILTSAAPRRELPSGEFWSEDLIGLEAATPRGVVLGVVVGVEFGHAQDRLVVETAEGARVLVPFVEAIVGDPADGRLTIDPPEGLF